MSFIFVATEIFGAGLAADIAAGAMMGGSITMGSNVLRGKNPFDNIGQGLLLGGLTAGISNGLGNSLSASGVTENAAGEAVKQGTLTPDLAAGPNINTLGNPIEASAIPAPTPDLAAGPNINTLGNPIEASAIPAPTPDLAAGPNINTLGNPIEASAIPAPTPDLASNISASSAAPPTLTSNGNPVDFTGNQMRVPPASDYKGALTSSGTGGLSSLSNLGKFAKDNWKMLTGIAAIGLLNQPKSGVTVPTRDLGGFHTGYYDPVTHRMVDTGGYIPYKDFGDKNIRDYTHARNGGLMGLANGGAVAFADGGTSMTSPYLNAINNPETIPLMSGETQDQGLARMQGYQTELDERNKRRMEAAGMQAPATIDYTQSPAGLNPSSPTVQTQADVDYWKQRGAGMAGSGFTTGGGDDSGNAERQNAYIKSLMANNPAPVGPTNAQMMAAQDQERAELAARRAAVSTGGNDFSITGPNSPQLVTPAPVIPRPNVPAAEGTPTERARAQGIQSLAKPDVPRPTAQTDGPPITRSGIEQLVHGSIYDPTTGHFRNPTAAELGAKAIADAKGNTAEMTQLTNQYFDSYKAGEVLDFAGGTLTKNADGTATHKYTDANGKQQTYTFSRGTDIATIANSDPNIANEWKGMFNYTPPKNTGSPIISTPGPTGPVLTPGTGSAGHVVQTPTGFTPTPAPPTRVPTSIEDFNTRFNKQTGDSAAQYDYLMGEGPEPKGTTNTEVAAPYWEKMGMSPVDKTRSSMIYDPTVKNAAGKVVGGYVKNPDFKPKVFDSVTKRLIDAPSSTSGSGSNANQPPPTEDELTNHNSKPNQDPGPDAEWVWIPATKRWVAIQNINFIDGGSRAANGGLMGYAAGGLGSLGGYSDGGQLLRGDGDGVSDSIPASIGGRQPARLANNEFVIPARIVSELGNGSTDAGAKRLYAMMDRVQNARKKSIGKGKIAVDTHADRFLPA